MLQSLKFHTNITHRFFNKINIYSYHLIYILISIQQFFMFKRIFSIYFKKKMFIKIKLYPAGYQVFPIVMCFYSLFQVFSKMTSSFKWIPTLDVRSLLLFLIHYPSYAAYKDLNHTIKRLVKYNFLLLL